jgi:hypothetical protein
MWYYVSTEFLTGGVEVDKNGYIVSNPPILTRFKNKHISELQNWITRHRLHVFEKREEEPVSLPINNDFSYREP